MTAISRKVVIGRRHCTMTLTSDGAFSVLWAERPRSLTAQELSQYMEARNALVSQMSHELAGHIDEPYRRATWEERAST
jgi:hypothetical protein